MEKYCQLRINKRKIKNKKEEQQTGPPDGQEKEILLCTVLQFWGFALASFHLSLQLYFKGEEVQATGVKLIPSTLLSKAAEEPIQSSHLKFYAPTRIPGFLGTQQN